jgi:hypothetical protein
MNQILYERRCRCKEELLAITKKDISEERSQGKSVKYIGAYSLLSPDLESPLPDRTFQIKYEKNYLQLQNLY